MRFLVAHTWNGARAESEEIVEIEARLTPSELVVEVAAPFHGDAPPAPGPGSCPRLWEHEVVECFLVGDDGRYLEIEVGPHGHYLLLLLRGPRDVEREGMTALYEVSRSGGRWAGRLVLDRALVPGVIRRANAFAIHGTAPHRRYLCWHPLPGEAPDFHQPDRFPDVNL